MQVKDEERDKGEGRGQTVGWIRRHPWLVLNFLLLVVFLGVFFGYKSTIPDRIVRELHAAGLPPTGEELFEQTKLPPAEDGEPALQEANDLFHSMLISEILAGSYSFSWDEGFTELEKRAKEMPTGIAAFQAAAPEIVQKLRKAARHPIQFPLRGTAFYAETKRIRTGLLYSEECPDLCKAILLDTADRMRHGDHRAAKENLLLLWRLRQQERVEASSFPWYPFLRLCDTTAVLAARSNLPAGELRELANVLLAKKTDDRLRENLRLFLISDAVYWNDFFADYRKNPQGRAQQILYHELSPLGKGIIVTGTGFLLEFNQQQLVRLDQELLLLDFSASRAANTPELERISQENLTNTGWNCIRSYYPTEILLDAGAGSFPPHHIRTIDDNYKQRAMTRLAGILCELAARLREGSPLPEDLSAFPPDPFTGKPFDLIRQKDALLLRSTGSDLRFSKPPAAPASPDEAKPGVQSEIYDDIVLRLPLPTPAQTQ